MRLAGFELYFDDLESAKRFYRNTLGLELTGEKSGHHAQFGANPFLCLERKGAESYPSRDKAVVFIEVPDVQAILERLGEHILQFEPGFPGQPAWAVLHDPEGHNVLLMQSSG